MSMRHVDGLQIVDVRGPGEITSGKIRGALEVPLARILGPARRPRPFRADRGVLRQRLPVDDRGLGDACLGVP